MYEIATAENYKSLNTHYLILAFFISFIAFAAIYGSYTNISLIFRHTLRISGYILIVLVILSILSFFRDTGPLIIYFEQDRLIYKTLKKVRAISYKDFAGCRVNIGFPNAWKEFNYTFHDFLNKGYNEIIAFAENIMEKRDKTVLVVTFYKNKRFKPLLILNIYTTTISPPQIKNMFEEWRNKYEKYLNKEN